MSLHRMLNTLKKEPFDRGQVTHENLMAIRIEFTKMRTRVVAEWPAVREQLAAAKNKLVT